MTSDKWGSPEILVLMAHQPKVRDRERQVGFISDRNFEIRIVGKSEPWENPPSLSGIRQLLALEAIYPDIRKNILVYYISRCPGPCFHQGGHKTYRKNQGKMEISLNRHWIILC